MKKLFANLLGASAVATATWTAPAMAQEDPEGPIVGPPVKPDHFKGDVRDLPKLPPGNLEGVEVNPRRVDPDEVTARPDIVPKSEPDPAVQSDFHGPARSHGCPGRFQNHSR